MTRLAAGHAGARRAASGLAALAVTLAACSERAPEAPLESGSGQSEQVAGRVTGSQTGVGTEQGAGPGFDLHQDPRISHWLAPGRPSGHFDLDTSDVGAVLIATLEKGQLEPLRRAKEELARGPVRDRERVRRLFHEHFRDPHREPLLSNALDVALLAEDETLVPLFASALEHPSERLRILGLRGLRKHGTPADFDAVLQRLEQGRFAEFDEALATLPHTDRARSEELLAGWLEQGVLEQRARLVAPDLARASSPRLRAVLAAALEPDLRPPTPALLVPYLVAGLAQQSGASGAEQGWGPLPFEPDQRLRELCADPDVNLRAVALDAAGAAGRLDIVLERVRTEEDDGVRLRALNLALAGEFDESLRSEFVRALDARSVALHELALSVLVAHGEPQAIDRAVGLVERGGSDRSRGMLVLRERLGDDAPLAERLFAILEREELSRRELPVDQNRSLYQALGSLPLVEAAERLVLASKEAHGEIAAHSAHRWLVLQVANVGDPGTEVLLAELEREHDPVRRIDLLEALTARPSERTREAALELVQGQELADLERLYLASRLVEIGPARSVLPVLKRVCLRVTEPAARRGFQSLLWHWYPRP